MTKRIKNYRSGDLKEGIGIELLRGIGATAPIPREEDLGADAVVTLFRPEGRLLFSTESFFVQLKSSKETEILFDSENVEWLRLLGLPFFIGLVDGESTSIQLYSTNCLYEFFAIDQAYTSITVKFGKGVTEDNSPKELVVYLREPILEWALKDNFSKEFGDLAYNVLSRWLEIEGDNVRFRRTGIYWHANWKTNEVPSLAAEFFGFGVPSPKELQRTLEYIEPQLARLMSQLAGVGGLAIEFPEYIVKKYKENNIECTKIESVIKFIEMTCTRVKRDQIDPDPDSSV